MEFMVGYWWLVNLVVFGVNFYFLYRAFKSFKKTGKKLNGWMIAFLVGATLYIIMPLKINGTNSNEVLRAQSYSIENSKVLPKKVEDNSFERGLKTSTKDITDKEIWK